MFGPASIRWSRRWHRWGAWGLSAFVLMWTVTGVVMIWPSAVPREAQRPPGEQLRLTDSIVPVTAALRALGGAAENQPLRGAALKALDGRLYWAFTFPRGTRLVDARSGERFEMTDSTAVRLARANLGASVEQRVEVRRLTQADGRYRGPLPAWRIQVPDGATAAYVATDGAVTLAETGFRWKNAAGSLHAFNVPGVTMRRDRLRKGLLLVTSAGTLALIVTGLVLLFPSAKRSA